MPRLYTLDSRDRPCLVENDATVIMRDVLLAVKKGGRDVYGDLHVRITSEGIITDAVVKGRVAGTACYPLDHLVDNLGDIR